MVMSYCSSSVSDLNICIYDSTQGRLFLHAVRLCDMQGLHMKTAGPRRTSRELLYYIFRVCVPRYVNLDCLKYHSCVTEEKRTGVLSYKGKTNASTTINIRNDADKNSYKVAEWKVGKVVDNSRNN